MNILKETFRKNAILIPALNPPDSLELYIKQLLEENFKYIILVDDGSNEIYSSLFERIVMLNNDNVSIVLLRHEKNYGKGRALKTGFEYFINNWPDLSGVITVDSDGQHRVKDVLKISNALDVADEPTIFLGSRSFEYDYVPFKSKFGNKCTSVIFSILNGRYLSDTQTGLRGFTKDIITNEFLNLTGERFEYELNMLIYAVRVHNVIKEIKIETVYIDNNRETHFHPIKDSWKVYKILFSQFFKFSFSSFASSLVDLGVFQLLLLILWDVDIKVRILMATIGARIISSIFNFFINRRIVFKNRAGKLFAQIVKYYTLCIIQMLLSAIFVIMLSEILEISEIVEKVFVDIMLFFISYRIQQKFIFTNGG